MRMVRRQADRPRRVDALSQRGRIVRDIKACGRVAVERDPSMAFLRRATPYSLRRGHISLRVLAGEDIKRYADDCGTSTAHDPQALPARARRATRAARDLNSTPPSRQRAAGSATLARPDLLTRLGECGRASSRASTTSPPTLSTLGPAWTPCPHRFLRPSAVPRQYASLAQRRRVGEQRADLQVRCPLSSVGRALPW
jgi:hypothetical protein